jgi:phage terminase small subunit
MDNSKALCARPKKISRRVPLEHKKLTRKQELFVKELVSKDGQITKRDAAINAGYPAGSAHSRATELTNPVRSPHVVKAIRLYRAELDARFAVDYKRHIRKLAELGEKAEEAGNWQAAISAEKFRGQAEGNIYISKSEVRHGSIDSMSRDEVLKALQELKEAYGANHSVGVKPEEAEEEASEREQSLDSVQDGSQEAATELETHAA